LGKLMELSQKHAKMSPGEQAGSSPDTHKNVETSNPKPKVAKR